MLGVSEIPDETPEHKRKSASTSKFTDDTRGDKESPKDCSSLKSCESFYTCPRAPFYRETKGLLHSKSTLRIQGIFLMWTHTWMSFTSRIFTSWTQVHMLNPDFWGNVFDLASCRFVDLLFMEALSRHNLRTITSEFDPSRFPNFADSNSRSSQVRDSRASQVQESRSLQIRDFRASQIQDSRSSQIRDFGASRVQDSRSSQCLVNLKAHFTRFVELGVSRVRGFSWISQH
jgi:hypothetical protein